MTDEIIPGVSPEGLQAYLKNLEWKEQQKPKSVITRIISRFSK